MIELTSGTYEAVVYYLGDREDQTIKIGTTTQLHGRVVTLAVAHRNRVLLAVEPGSFPLERRRHKQFATLRVQGEWFRKAPVLMDHINAMRLAHGMPPKSVLRSYFICPLVTGRSGVPVGD